MKLEATWGRTVRIWWAFFWRNLIAIVVSVIAGGVVGFIVGFVMGVFGADTETITAVTAPMGFVIGLAISIVPLRMILNKDFGEFRLVLVSTKEQVVPSESVRSQSSTEPRQRADASFKRRH